MRSHKLVKLIPFLGWIRHYSLKSLKIDFVAGIGVGLVLIPQSMANAQLAGLPAHYGLYAALFPTIISALFSSSKYMCTSMVAIVAMMTASALEPLALAGSPGYIAYAITLSFMVGIIQILLRVLRLSFLVNFMSQPVISGFTNAALILIALSQLGKIFGVTVESGSTQMQTLLNVIIAARTGMHWPTLALALLAVVIITFLPKITHKLPAILTAVVITTFISWAIGYEKDMPVPVGDIRSPATHYIIGTLNRTHSVLESLQDERYNLSKAAQSDDVTPASTVELQYQIEQIDIVSRRLKGEMKVERAKLRQLQFALDTTSDKPVFIERTALDTGPAWRLKFSGEAPNQEKVIMSSGGMVVGNIPTGLPDFILPDVNGGDIATLLPFAFAIAFIALANTISVAKNTARVTGDRIDNKQELLAQGLANIASGLSQSGPVAGSFSSSAVNCRSGATSAMSAVFAGLTTLACLLFLTRLMYFIPLSVLAAVVILSMVHQIKFSVFRQEWRVQWFDGIIGVVTFLATLLTAPHLDIGLLIGVTLSMIVFIYRTMHPAISVLGYGLETRRVSDVKMIKDHVACEYVSVLRFQQALVFINSNILEEYVVELMETKPDLKHIHLVCTGINDIDASGEDSLAMLVRWVRKAGLTISLNGINEKVMEVLQRSGILYEIGRENIFHTMLEGICVAHGRLDETQDKNHKCSWQQFCE